MTIISTTAGRNPSEEMEYPSWSTKESEMRSIQFSSVIQSCPTLCDPINRSMPGLPVHHQLPELTRFTSIESVMPSSHLILCRPLLLMPSIFPSSFQISQLFASGGQRIGVSASTSVLPMKTQDRSPLGWTGWRWSNRRWQE